MRAEFLLLRIAAHLAHVLRELGVVRIQLEGVFERRADGLGVALRLFAGCGLDQRGDSVAARQLRSHAVVGVAGVQGCRLLVILQRLFESALFI